MNKIGQVRNAKMPKLKYVFMVVPTPTVNFIAKSMSITLKSDDTYKINS